MSLHPSLAAVRAAVRRTLAEVEAEVEGDGGAVLVACSGGADSLALLSAAVHETRRRGADPSLRVVGVTVDHGLQEGSADRAAHVVAQMAALGADETASARVQVAGGGRGPEAAAREARYAVLEEMAQHFGALAVLLGHTRDDQAETVLLGLTRGSGGRSLAGMRRGFGRYRRPLLDVTRDDTVTACQVEGLVPWEDPHNLDPGYARVRVRRRVLPVLEEELGPGVAAALARTADQLRADTELLDDLADAAHAELRDAAGMDVAALRRLPEATRTRVLRLAALEAGATDAELFHVHVTALDRLVGPGGGGEVQLPGHVTARVAAAPGDRGAERGPGRLRFGPTAVRG